MTPLWYHWHLSAQNVLNQDFPWEQTLHFTLAVGEYYFHSKVFLSAFLLPHQVNPNSTTCYSAHYGHFIMCARLWWGVDPLRIKFYELKVATCAHYWFIGINEGDGRANEMDILMLLCDHIADISPWLGYTAERYGITQLVFLKTFGSWSKSEAFKWSFAVEASKPTWARVIILPLKKVGKDLGAFKLKSSVSLTTSVTKPLNGSLKAN